MDYGIVLSINKSHFVTQIFLDVETGRVVTRSQLVTQHPWISKKEPGIQTQGPLSGAVQFLIGRSDEKSQNAAVYPRRA